MNKLLSIIGPTATGKTSLAFKISREMLKKKMIVGIDLISADSRQIYQQIEITSGTDIPTGFGYKKNNDTSNLSYWYNPDRSIRLFGVSNIQPNQEWSVGHFKQLAEQLIHQSWQEHRLPIVVGGTGLYYQHLFDPDPKLRIKPNKKVRQKVEKMTVTQLQKWLKKVDQNKFNKLNQSDVQNPRRLIRAIEIGLHPLQSPALSAKIWSLTNIPAANHFTLGLKNTLTNLKKKITQRVKKRFENGSVKEIKTLLENHPPGLPALTTLGITDIRDYLHKKTSAKECQQLWSLHEYQYLKRQNTWWKKRTNIKWFSVAQSKYEQLAISAVKDWLAV